MDWSWLTDILNLLISDEFVSVMAIIAVWGFFISGIDDLYIDIRYVLNVIFRERIERVTGAQIKMIEAEKQPEKPIAVMVPAWQEASVIRGMLMRNVANIDYVNYHIFVGTYPNDHETQHEVDAAIAYYRRIRVAQGSSAKVDFIHKIVTPKPGPTNKADNLNTVFRSIKNIEKELMIKGDLDRPFEIFVMHDCEDVIHPKELKLFNYLMTNKPHDERKSEDPHLERYDFVQTPVFPLEVDLQPDLNQMAPVRATLSRIHWYNPITWVRFLPRLLWQSLKLSRIFIDNLFRYSVSATYMEEFAEHHTKDMIVRRNIKGLVPSAGVGTGINRKYLEILESENPKGIFNDVHLAEDYEISLKLKNLGANQFFAIEPVTMLKFKDADVNVTEEVEEYVATKEYFPDTVMAAVRQKARWVMGITYQTMFPEKREGSWSDMSEGWQGSLVTKYTLFRDRKALLTNYINMLGYFVFIYCLTKLLMVAFIDYEWSFSKIFPYHSYIWWLVFFNTILMIERFLQRFNAVQKIYGPRHAIYYLMRTFMLVGLLLGNLINFMATIAATRRYLTYIFKSAFATKKKTTVTKKDAVTGLEVEHEEDEEERPVWGKTDHQYLSDEQMREYVNPIGQLALRARLIEEKQLQEALTRQSESGKKLGDVLCEMGYLDEVGFSLLYAQQLAMPAQEIDPFRIDRKVLKMIPEDLAEKHQVVPLAIDETGSLILAASNPISTQEKLLLEHKTGRHVKVVITYQSDIDFSRRRAYGLAVGQEASHVPRIGYILLTKGILSEDQLSEALHEQAESRRPIGEILLNRGFINESQLEHVLREQKHKRRQIGEAFIERGLINESQLKQALYKQKTNGKPIGELLLCMGLIKESDLDSYFRETYGVGFHMVTPEEIDLGFLQQFPRAFCAIHRALPISAKNGHIKIAVSNMARGAMAEMLEHRFGKPVDLFLAPDDNVSVAMKVCFDNINGAIARHHLLGNRLLEAGHINEKALQDALDIQKNNGQRLGEILVDGGFVKESNLLEVYADDLFLPHIKIMDRPDKDLAGVFPLDEATSRLMVPLHLYENTLTCALSYTFKLEDVCDFERRFPMMKINYVMASKEDINEAIRRLYDFGD